MAGHSSLVRCEDVPSARPAQAAARQGRRFSYALFDSYRRERKYCDPREPLATRLTCTARPRSLFQPHSFTLLAMICARIMLSLSIACLSAWFEPCPTCCDVRAATGRF